MTDGSEARNIESDRQIDSGSQGSRDGSLDQGTVSGSSASVTQLRAEPPVSTPAKAVEGPLPDEKLQKVLSFIDKNLGTSIQLSDLSEVVSISPFHFSRRFKSATGLSPYRFIMHQRVEHAKELLAQRNITLTDIALSCGFANQPHFTTVFRKIAGITPAVYRRKLNARSGPNGSS